MQAPVKTRRIKPARHEYRLTFKRNTPKAILTEAEKRYAPYLTTFSVDPDDEFNRVMRHKFQITEYIC